jgi:hypothetical protein
VRGATVKELPEAVLNFVVGIANAHLLVAVSALFQVAPA